MPVEQFLVRNYLLDKTHVEELGVQWLQPDINSDIVHHIEWVLGAGIENKESLMIQYKYNLQTKTSVI